MNIEQLIDAIGNKKIKKAFSENDLVLAEKITAKLYTNIRNKNKDFFNEKYEMLALLLKILNNIPISKCDIENLAKSFAVNAKRNVINNYENNAVLDSFGNHVRKMSTGEEAFEREFERKINQFSL